MKNNTLKITLLIIIISITNLNAQKNSLKVFEQLTNKVWKADGKWGDGSAFKQEIVFEFSLDSPIIIASSKGFTNQNQTQYGNRNHGIRKFDKGSGKLKFWEFDVFGGETSGEIIIDGNNIYYVYKYGNSLITDAWIKENDNSYTFIVGERKGNKWAQKFLETKFEAIDREAELLNTIKSIDDALINSDYIVLEKLLDDNLNVVAEYGTIIHKQPALKSIKNSSKKNKPKEIINSNVKISFSENTAYVIMKTRHVYTNLEDKNYNVISTYKSKNGSWKLEFISTTLIK